MIVTHQKFRGKWKVKTVNPHGFSEWHRSELSLREGRETYTRKVSIIFFHRIRSSELSNEAVFSFNIDGPFSETTHLKNLKNS